MDQIETQLAGSARHSGAGATNQIARHLAGLSYTDLPADLIDLTKQCVLDTLGVTIGASSLAPEAKLVMDYVTDLGGKPESSILGFGGKAPAPWATFVNGSLGHMLDYDDIGGGGHPSITTVLVGFAIAEKLGAVTGRDFITALAGGMDLQTRLAAAIDIPDWTIAEGWFATQLLGFLSGAATAGRLFNLDEAAMANALGIGFNQMSGSRQMAVGAATHMRSMQAGFSGQGAILAADLARRGVVGSKDVLEGRYGVFRTYVRTDTPDWPALVDGLGTRFPLLDLHGFKVWPACGYTRPTNAATLQLREKYHLRPEDIETITVIGGSGGTKLLSEPLEQKRRPRLSIDGKYSIPFTTAVMMVKGTVTLRDYTDEGLRDPAVLAMADRVFYRARLPSDGPGFDSAGLPLPTIEIKTKDGRTLSHTPDGVPGDPRYPIDWPLVEAKFRDCASFSLKPIPAGNVERAIALVRNLETLSDVTDIVRLLV
jgi:2-methylcitrate dehydratase PrpD